MSDLKPCRKCEDGGSLTEVSSTFLGVRGYWVRCDLCGFQSEVCTTRRKANEAWNRRANDGD